MPRSERLPTYTEAHTHTWSLLAEGPALNVGAGADWSELSERCWLSVLLALDVRSQLSGYLIIIHILSTFIIKHFLIAGHKHTNCIDRFKLQSFINLTCNCKSWEILRSSVTEIRAAGVCLNQIWLIFDFTSVPSINMENSQLELVKEITRCSTTDTERFLTAQTQQVLHQQYFYDLYRPYNQW